MKNIAYILVAAFMFFSCEKHDHIVFDSVGGQSIATFTNKEIGDLLVSPSADFVTPINVNVSTTSTVDRIATISIDPASTLDPSVYNLESNTFTIPAGSHFGTVNIITLAGASFNTNDGLIIHLDSVDGAQIVEGSIAPIKILLVATVGCTFISDDTVGTWTITQDDFGSSVGDNTFEVIAGPGENQVTMINPFDHVNPDTGQGDYDIIIDIAPNSGSASIAKQAAWHCDNFGCGFGEGSINSDGNGKVLSCAGTMEFDLKHTVSAGSFGTYAFKASKI